LRVKSGVKAGILISNHNSRVKSGVKAAS
jgi:hypothetical protein